MNFRKRIKEHAETGFDLTPMVDIVLLLLSFFVMGSQFAQVMRKPMDLARLPGEEARAESPRAIVVDLLSDGTLRLSSGRPVAVAEFVAMVKAELQAAGAQGASRTSTAFTKGSGAVELTVRPERTTPARHLNKLAGELARAGVRSWRLATAGAGASAPEGGAP
jgi:biopolymer transport protein ExbD